jgi:hypothetical protein
MEIGNRLNTKGNCQSSNAFHKREATRPLVPQAYIVGMPWSVEKARFATAAAETCMTCQELQRTGNLSSDALLFRTWTGSACP